MPFVLKSNKDSRSAILILAFGKLSLLEFCSVFSGTLSKAVLLCDRAAFVTLEASARNLVSRLGGIHKWATPARLITGLESSDFLDFLKDAVEYQDKIQNISLSEYCEANGGPEYEDMVHALMAGIRQLGFKKVRLLRPKGNELHAEQVVLRRALDFLTVHSAKGQYFGVVSYVPDVGSYRALGREKPVRSPATSMSPRLARTLVNLAALSPGQTLLDPFCGSGTILAEGLLQSLRCVGFDRDRHRVRQAEENLKWLERELGSELRATYHVEYGDARELDRRVGGASVDAVVTEPILLPNLSARPSEKNAREMMRNSSRIYSDALHSISRAVKRGGRIVLVVPALETTSDSEASIVFDDVESLGLQEFQPPRSHFEYPVRLSFESTRWVKRAVYVFVKR